MLCEIPLEELPVIIVSEGASGRLVVKLGIVVTLSWKHDRIRKVLV